LPCSPVVFFGTERSIKDQSFLSSRLGLLSIPNWVSNSIMCYVQRGCPPCATTTPGDGADVTSLPCDLVLPVILAKAMAEIDQLFSSPATSRVGVQIPEGKARCPIVALIRLVMLRTRTGLVPTNRLVHM